MRGVFRVLAAAGLLAAPAHAEDPRTILPEWAPVASILHQVDDSDCRFIVADLAPDAPARPQSRFAARPGTFFGARWQPTPANRTLLGQMSAAACADTWPEPVRNRFWRALGIDGAFVAIDPAARDALVQRLGLYAPNVGLIVLIDWTSQPE